MKKLYVRPDSITSPNCTGITVLAEKLGGIWHVDGDKDSGTPDSRWNDTDFHADHVLAESMKNEGGSWICEAQSAPVIASRG